VFRLLEISIGDSLGPGTPTLDPIPNIGFPKSLMTAQLHVARESDAPEQCGCSRRRRLDFWSLGDVNAGGD